jgi:hypothetical protein
VADPGRTESSPWIGLPATFDRRLRMGPFPSVRDALKFATYAAVGAIPAALVAPIWWIPFLGGGFLVAIFHPEGKPADERVGEFVAYHWRRGTQRAEVSKGRRGGPGPGPTVAVGGAALAAVLDVPGTPVAFLPPADSRALFDRFRDLLNALEGGLYIVAGIEPIVTSPFQPAAEPAPRAPEARAGYAEMVRILCQRRQRRRVLVVVWVRRGAGAEEKLERSVRAVTDHLGRLGLPAERLSEDRLGVVLRRIGWARAP